MLQFFVFLYIFFLFFLWPNPRSLVRTINLIKHLTQYFHEMKPKAEQFMKRGKSYKYYFRISVLCVSVCLSVAACWLLNISKYLIMAVNFCNIVYLYDICMCVCLCMQPCVQEHSLHNGQRLGVLICWVLLLNKPQCYVGYDEKWDR